MIYSTPEFFLFFTLVCALFFLTRSQGARFYVLLGGSIIFYAWAGIFDSLIFLFVVLVSWAFAWLAARFPAQKKLYLALGIAIMAFHLFFWKYAVWASRETQRLFPAFLGGEPLQLPLPVGISFFTLQGIAYLIDMGRSEAKLMSLKEFALFKSFFPQLIAGPIVRYHQLAPQLRSLVGVPPARIVSGLGLFCLGFFKKIAIADRCAPFVDAVFAAPDQQSRSVLLLALLGYTVQIWADFSGYTDMGRGAAKMLGVQLPENFFSPYLSASPSEFWRRWHVTLSQWIRDYIYIPLGGGTGSMARVMCTAIVTMLISCLWHGANWTFLLWGLYHGFLLALERALKTAGLDWSHGWKRAAGIAVTFSLVVFGWLLFRANELSRLGEYLSGLLHPNQAAGVPAQASSVVAGAVLCFLLHVALYSRKPEGEPFLLSSVRGTVGALQVACERRAGLAAAAGIVLGLFFSAVVMAGVGLRFESEQNAFIYFQF